MSDMKIVGMQALKKKLLLKNWQEVKPRWKM